ncbi:two component transcriptional regulator, LuxR family [Fulvimarina manganoxydans]|uniref:Two component transcriptional regulator, LuxR family n=1 Tax=Fulvimarina manganoxydans TaxID=937218 RepID=A0A1W2DMK8_9HYPH|nr:response regulator transcription factor [Fulvimarina manganoxydans]SMC98256.1 two component transcriptional regulator, LuxR family [Fulvimarina manganoxydans]
MSGHLKILSITQKPCFYFGLKTILENFESTANFELVEATSVEAAYGSINTRGVDGILVDVSRPGIDPDECLRLARTIARRYPILVISAYDQPYIVKQAFECNIAGYLLSSAPPSDIAQAVAKIAAGENYLDPALVPRLVGKGHRAPGKHDPMSVVDEAIRVTKREVDVLKRIAYGFSAKEIARDLELSQKSVETYKARGAAKLNLQSRADIVRFAHDVGWFVTAH